MFIATDGVAIAGRRTYRTWQGQFGFRAWLPGVRRDGPANRRGVCPAV